MNNTHYVIKQLSRLADNSRQQAELLESHQGHTFEALGYRDDVEFLMRVSEMVTGGNKVSETFAERIIEGRA